MSFTQVPDKSAGDVFTEAMWDTYIRDNLNKLGVQGHRVLTVAQFLALTGLEDGDEAYVEVDGTAGIQWHLRYLTATTKWRFLGGPPLTASVATDEATAGSSSSYADIATAGPSVTVPLAGDYRVTFGANTYNTSNAGNVGAASPSIAGGSATDANAGAAAGGGTAAGSQVRLNRAEMPVAGLAAANVVKLQYRTPGGGTTQKFKDRQISVVPARIG